MNNLTNIKDVYALSRVSFSPRRFKDRCFYFYKVSWTLFYAVEGRNGPTIVSQPREVKYSFGWFRISHSFSNRNLNSQFSSFQRCYLQAASGNVNARMLPPSRQQFQAPMCCAPCTATGGSGTRLRATHPRLTLKRVGLPDLRFLAFEMQTLSVPLSFGCYSPAVEGAISEPWQ